MNKCPGQDDRNIQVESLTCPACGYELEIFSDEIKIKCPNCKKIACRARLPSCVDWCKYAKDCVGNQEYDGYIRNKNLMRKNQLIKEMEEYFAEDIKRINHAKKVLLYAEELLTKEGGDWNILLPASILHDIGIKIAEKKYGSSGGKYQEKEGPEIARKILLKLDFSQKDIEEICQIIAHHHSPGVIGTINFKILYDADCLVNLKDEFNLSEKNKLRERIAKIFLTPSGRELAEKLYL